MKEVIYELMPVFSGAILGFVVGVSWVGDMASPFWRGFLEGMSFKPIIDWIRRKK